MKMRNSLIGMLAATALSAGSLAMAGKDHAHEGMQHGDEQTAETATGTGEVRSLGKEGENITLYHEPIPELNWPAMVMQFTLTDPTLAEGLEPGDKVEFTLRETEQAGEYEIIEIRRAE